LRSSVPSDWPLRALQLGLQAAAAPVGLEVERDAHPACGFNGVAQLRGGGVDQAAFEPGLSQHAFAPALEGLPVGVGEAQQHALERGAGKALLQVRAPA